MTRITKTAIGALVCLIVAATATAVILRKPTPSGNYFARSQGVSHEMMPATSDEWMEIHYRGPHGKDTLTYIVYRNNDFGIRRYHENHSPESLTVFYEDGQQHRQVQYANDGKQATSDEELRADGSLRSRMTIDSDGYRTTTAYWLDGKTVFSRTRGKLTSDEVDIDYFYADGHPWVKYNGRKPVPAVNFPTSGYYVQVWSDEGKLLLDGHHNDGTNTSTVIVNHQDGSRYYVQELHPESYMMLSLGDKDTFHRSLRSVTVYTEDGKRVAREVTILYPWQNIGTVVDHAEDGSRIEYNQFGTGKFQSIRTFDKDGNLVSEMKEGVFPQVEEKLLLPPVIGDPRVEWEKQEKLHATKPLPN